MLKSAQLSNNARLAGPIPTTIGLLTNLENFVVTESAISGTIPPEIGELTLLKTLSLEGNMLLGSLPTTMGLLSSLQFLQLKDNALSGTIPTTVSGMKNLMEVDFSFNLFVDGAENICNVNSTILSKYETDCIAESLPSIPQEICRYFSACLSFDVAYHSHSISLATSLLVLHRLLQRGLWRMSDPRKRGPTVNPENGKTDSKCK